MMIQRLTYRLLLWVMIVEECVICVFVVIDMEKHVYSVLAKKTD